ncbi:LOW QUALITY PROTEIN: hypothetical protein NC652_013570 [Populus alba x Populus x berolinensis]|nr:LOW QUALITY PROTEIN: hypothetical protein NC652_013570 [Populus alba x Populus x berolinensis]
MEVDDGNNHSWADLPEELLEMIRKRLDSRIDVYRFRAVCTSWRSSISLFYKQSPRVPLKLPKPIRAHAYLSQVTVCRVELVDDSEDSSSSSSMTWLTKVEESTYGDIQLLAPVSNRQLRTDSPGMMPKMLNLGQAYVVDRLGTVYWIDSSLNLIQYSPPLYGCGSQKSLVESDGDFYVVDRFFDGERRTWNELHNLSSDVAYPHSFSVSAREFSGREGNCIYFIDPFDASRHGELSGRDARVCDLSSGRISKQIFLAILACCGHLQISIVEIKKDVETKSNPSKDIACRIDVLVLETLQFTGTIL